MKKIKYILQLLYKHKWTVLIPVIFMSLYFGIPYTKGIFAGGFHLVITPSNNVNLPTQKETLTEVKRIKEEIYKDNEYLESLITNHNLLAEQRSKGVSTTKLVEQVRKSLWFSVREGNKSKNITLFGLFWGQDENTTSQVTKDIAKRFELDLSSKLGSTQSLTVAKYIDKIQKHTPNLTYGFVSGAIKGALFALFLIILIEFPNLFYSKKVHEEVFDPLFSDWHYEKNEAKLEGKFMKVHLIDFRYTYAFLLAMWQKSPFGDLVEFIRKLAR